MGTGSGMKNELPGLDLAEFETYETAAKDITDVTFQQSNVFRRICPNIANSQSTIMSTNYIKMSIRRDIHAIDL